MFCQNCGTAINEGSACACGFRPTPQRPAANDLVNIIAGRLSINQLVVLGGCFLLFIFMFLPFMSISLGAFGSVSTSGFSMVFGSDGSFSGFLNLLLPLLAVAGLSFTKFAYTKTLVFGVAFLGAYINFSTLVGMGTQLVGVGLVLSFIIWLVVAAAAFMEFRGINLLNDLVRK